ncbi:MAG: hypothetical protein IJD70_08720 [Clostridia bacterium]|nr:hypothetical protein [Clostridia bacterium]
MPSPNQQILKGYYQYSQINNFVSVKNFMFVKDNKKNGLLIRFSNDSDFRVDSMSFTIVQLDSTGSTIGKNNVTLKSLDFMPGTNYSSNDPIIVGDNCSNFKLYFTEVRSGNYRYRIRHGKIITDYCKADPDTIETVNINSSGDLSVKPRRFGKPAASRFLAGLLLLLILAANAFRMFSVYYEHERERIAQEKKEQEKKEKEEKAESGEETYVFSETAE